MYCYDCKIKEIHLKPKADQIASVYQISCLYLCNTDFHSFTFSIIHYVNNNLQIQITVIIISSIDFSKRTISANADCAEILIVFSCSILD